MSRKGDGKASIFSHIMQPPFDIVCLEEDSMKSRSFKFLIAAAASTALVATPVLAEKADRLLDLNGARGSSAESELQQRGFEHVSTHKSNSGYINSYWWNERDDNCVVVEVYDGRVMTINDATDQDCGHHKGNAAAAAGAVAGAAILGALLSHKSHHREGKQYDETKTAEFDRGYKDGLYGASYHNYNRDDAYAHGYEKGVDEREANLSHHHHRGGYAQAAQWQDLIGSRAAGGMSELESRGFKQVDNFSGGNNARYSIQYRAASRQCLQVIVADGRLENITDIQTHPKCR